MSYVNFNEVISAENNGVPYVLLYHWDKEKDNEQKGGMDGMMGNVWGWKVACL